MDSCALKTCTMNNDSISSINSYDTVTTKREIDPTDFYFEDPALQFPMLLSPSSHHPGETPSVFPATTKSVYDSQFPRKRTRCPSGSSKGTDTTSSTEEDDYSCCGSLTYSVESWELGHLLDEDGTKIANPSKSNKHYYNDNDKDNEDHRNCFQLFDGLLNAIRRIVEPEPLPRSSVYFEFDEYFGKNKKAIR